MVKETEQDDFSDVSKFGRPDRDALFPHLARYLPYMENFPYFLGYPSAILITRRSELKESYRVGSVSGTSKVFS